MRVAVFISHYNLGASAAIINTCLTLTERGIDVDVFSYKNTHERFVDLKSEKIHFVSLSFKEKLHASYANKFENIRNDIFINYVPKNLTAFLLDKRWSFQLKRDGIFAIIPLNIIDKTKEYLSKDKYTAYIGIEPSGLIWAGLMGGGDSIPLIYLSLELYLDSDHRFQRHYFKAVNNYAREIHQRAVATIIQDKARGELLAKHDGVPISKFLFIPVAMKGKPITEKNTYLYDKLEIPRDLKIVLCVGGINEDRLTLETAMAASFLPDGWTMVLHGWYEDVNYVKKIKGLCGEKLYLSTDLLPFEQLWRVVSSAHVGLSFYKDEGDNERLVGAASGKMAHYFQCGLPVIACDFESIKRIIDDYKCGVCVSMPASIPEALNKIIGRYEDMSHNAFRCYKEKFEMSFHFEQVFNLLNRLESGELRSNP